MNEKAAELLRILQDAPQWKIQWMRDITELCIEYMTLDGLQDAKRGSDIEIEIIDIMEKVINE